MKKALGLIIGLMTVFGGVSLNSSSVFAEASSPLTEEEQTVFSQNNIVFYEPCSGENKEDVGTLDGNDNKERVWNWFAKAGIKGVSDNPVVISGIMGNIEQESGYNPFASNGTYYGLYQEDNADMRKYVENKVGPVKWGTSTDDAEKNSKAIAAELEWLQDTSDFKQFVKDLNAPSSKTGDAGAKAYAELFLVRYERAVGGSESIQDKGVYSYMQKMYGGTVYQYQQTSNRRDYAVEVYHYVQQNKTGLTPTSSGASSGDKQSGVHEKAWELANQTKDASYKGPTDEYLKAQKDEKCPDGCVNNGQSCDRYVATTVRSSGVDKEIPWGAVNDIEDYMIKHSDIYVPVNGDAWNEETYQPGDIRVRIDLNKGPNWRGHIEIYGEKNNEGYILSASNGDRWAGYQPFFTEDKASHEYHIYRTETQAKCFSNTDCGKDSMNINATAVCLAWPEGTDRSKWECNGKYKVHGCKSGSATPAFEKAIDEVYGDKHSKHKSEEYHKSWSPCPSVGASCDVGGGVVVRYSGVDKKFPRGLYADDHAKKHSDIWDTLNYHTTPLEPGDVIEASENGHHHRWIYVEDEKGQGWVVESGLCHSFLHVSGKYSKNKKSKAGTWIYRAKNANNSTTGVNVKEGVSGSGGNSSGGSSSGGSSSTGSTSSSSGHKVSSGQAQDKKDISAAALEIGWPKGEKKSKWQTSPGSNKGDWAPVGREYYDTFKFNAKHGTWEDGASCSVYVMTVLNYAGVVNVDKSGLRKSPEGIADFLSKQDGWEEVEIKKVEDYKPGDVLIRTHGGTGNQGHAALYIDVGGEGYRSEASYEAWYGHVSSKVTKVMSEFDHVYRYTGATGSDECDRCTTDDDASGTGLKEGGMTLEEAKKFMEPYIQEASKKETGHKMFSTGPLAKAYINDAGCWAGTLNNCVAFSQWFINKYTTKGPKWNNTRDGELMVGQLGSEGLKTGKEPRPYAIFSTTHHTGVVLGVESDKVVIGEAGCSPGYKTGSDPWPRATTITMAKAKSAYTYAYTDDIIDPGAFSN